MNNLKTLSGEVLVLSTKQQVRIRPNTVFGSTLREVTKQLAWDPNTDRYYWAKTEMSGAQMTLIKELGDNVVDNYQRTPSNVRCYIGVDFEVEPNGFYVYVENNGNPFNIEMNKTIPELTDPEVCLTKINAGTNFAELKGAERVGIGMNGIGVKGVVMMSRRLEFTSYDAMRGRFIGLIYEDAERVHRELRCDIEPKPTHQDSRTVFKAHVETAIGDELASLRKSTSVSTGTFSMHCIETDRGIILNNLTIGARLAGIEVRYRNRTYPHKSFAEIAATMINLNESVFIESTASAGWRFKAYVYESNEQSVCFVNNSPCYSGPYMNACRNYVTKELQEMFDTKDLNLSIKVNIALFATLECTDPKFDSQQKTRLTEFKHSRTMGTKITGSNKEVMRNWEAYKLIISELKRLSRKKVSDSVKNVTVGDCYEAGDSSATCLVLTEGNSARSTMIKYLGAFRTKVGILALRGNPTNVRCEISKLDESVSLEEHVAKSHILKQLLNVLNISINESGFDSSKLRYNKILVASDSDTDGNHICGLLLSFINIVAPKIINSGGFYRFQTPVERRTKGNVREYSYGGWEPFNKLPGFKHKYMKGLGSISDADLSGPDRETYRLLCLTPDPNYEESLERAFGDDPKIRRHDFLKYIQYTTTVPALTPSKSASPLGKLVAQRNVLNYSITDFCRREMVVYSKDSAIRVLPGVDGLTATQRKIVTSILEMKDDESTKVASLVGSIIRDRCYHHGNVSLSGAVISMARTYPGSNNVPLLIADGQVGSRAEKGEDAASDRYVSVIKPRYMRHLFPSVLNTHTEVAYEDGQAIGPKLLYALIPLMLVNGYHAFGYGWSTGCPAYPALEIIHAIKTYLGTNGVARLRPGWHEYSGRETQLNSEGSMTMGSTVSVDHKGLFTIKELPPNVSFKTFREKLAQWQVPNTPFTVVKEDPPTFSTKFTDEGRALIANRKKWVKMGLSQTYNHQSIRLWNDAGTIEDYTVEEYLRQYALAVLNRYNYHLRMECEKKARELHAVGEQIRYIRWRTSDRCPHAIHKLSKPAFIQLLDAEKIDHSVIKRVNDFSMNKDALGETELRWQQLNQELKELYATKAADLYFGQLNELEGRLRESGFCPPRKSVE